MSEAISRRTARLRIMAALIGLDEGDRADFTFLRDLRPTPQDVGLGPPGGTGGLRGLRGRAGRHPVNSPRKTRDFTE